MCLGPRGVHGQARRVVQLDVLYIELRRPARPPPARIIMSVSDDMVFIVIVIRLLYVR